MKDKYDVVIIGAGPAGLSCAEVLAKGGKSVLVLEKNHKVGPKICAGGLTAKVEEDKFLSLQNVDNIFYSFKLHFSKMCKEISDSNPLVATIDRGKLGEIMLGKVLKSGAEVKIETEVKEIKENSIIANGQEIKYNYLIGADGSNSTVRRFLGVKTEKMLITLQYIIPQDIQNFEEMEYFFDSKISSCYFYIFPHKDFTMVGGGYCSKTVFKNPFGFKNTFEKWLKDHQIKTDGLKLESFPINFDYQGYQFGNKFLIGDAGGFASGLTGEGIYFAMVSGKEVAKKIINPQYDCSGISKILKIKRDHENFFKLINFLNNFSPNLGFKIVLFFYDLPLFKKIIERVTV